MKILQTLLLFLAFHVSALAAPLTSVGPTITTYTDTGVADGITYYYWVTATGPACPAQPVCGESVPSNMYFTTVSNTGTHTVTLTWVLSTSSGVTGQNIYRTSTPLPPTGLAGVVN